MDGFCSDAPIKLKSGIRETYYMDNSSSEYFTQLWQIAIFTKTKRKMFEPTKAGADADRQQLAHKPKYIRALKAFFKLITAYKNP